MLIPPADERELRKLVFGSALGVLSDQALLLAVPTLALLLLGLSASQASMLVAAEWLPRLILGSVAGRLSDLVNRKHVMVAGATVACIAIVGVVCVIFVSRELQFVILFCACFMYSAGGAFYAVAAAATVPEAVTRLTAADGIALQAGAQSSARVVGQAVAGPLAQLLGPVAAALASLALAVSRLANSVRLQSWPAQRRAGAGNLADSWRLMWRDARLRYLTAATLTMNLGGSIILGAFFPFAYQELHLAPFAVGVMLFVGGIASVLAAHRARLLLARLNPVTLCIAAGIAAPAAIWIIPLAAFVDARITLPVYEALFSAAATVFAVSFSVVQQRTVQNAQLGSLVGVTSTLCAAAIVSGTFSTSVLIDTIGIFHAILTGCVVTSLGVIALFALRASTHVDGLPDPSGAPTHSPS